MNDSYFEKCIKEQDEKIKILQDKIDKLSDTKAPSKLLYLFIGSFTLIYIMGMVMTYKQSTENMLIFQKGIAGVRITQTELKERLTYTSIKTEQIDKSMFRMQDKLDKAILDIREELRKK